MWSWTCFVCMCVCIMTDNGMYGTLRFCVGTLLSTYCCHEISEVRWFAGTTSAGTWRHTLGVPSVSNAAAAASRLLHEVDVYWHCCSPSVQVISCVIYHNTCFIILTIIPVLTTRGFMYPYVPVNTWVTFIALLSKNRWLGSQTSC